ncbi:hypothetical protein Dimus_021186 [Dionaea muscipula]
MPLEPLPWADRKEFFRERRHSHERPSESSYLGPPPPPPPAARWRDSYGSRGEFSRWGFGPDFRHPPGHGKQGGWHVYPDEPHYGYSIHRSGNRFLEDDGFRAYGPRGDGRYVRNYRENRGTFNQREWRGPAWENNHHQHGASVSASARQHDVNDQRLVDDVLVHVSPRTDSMNTFNEHHHKHQAGKPTDGNGSGMGPGQRVDQETSLGTDWRPLKWSRTGILTSRNSSFSHSTSSRSIGGESSDTRGEIFPEDATPVESLQGDPSACATSDAPSEDASSRKKPRLGWGEGLAKYEKKKVEGPDDNANNITETLCAHYTEPSRSVTSSHANRSPKLAGFADCVSPTTPSSVACCSSPGLEEKLSTEVADIEIDASNMSASPLTVPDIQNASSSFNLEDFDPGSITNLNAMLVELLQSEDQNSVDAGFVKTSAQGRLMLWKRDITKALERTESEIDSLETELKSLRSEPGRESLHPVSSGSLSMDCMEQLPNEVNVILEPPSQEVVQSGVNIQEMVAPCGNAIEITHNEQKGVVVVSHGTVPVASKFVEPQCLEKSKSPDEQKSICCALIVDVKSTILGSYPLASSSDIKKIAGPSDGDSSKMVQERDIYNGGNECPTAVENDRCNKILASNKVAAANAAAELFLKSLATCDYQVDNVSLARVPCGKTKLLIKNKFLLRKQFLKFKEKVIYLKHRAFQHLWKEDLRLLSVRKHRAKSQKKLEQSLRILHNGHQKYRSSIRSRFASPAGSLSLVPMTEMVTFTSNLLSDSQMKLYRDNLKMPALILDEKEKVFSRFISYNGLVEDPCAVEKERGLINPWTAAEKEVFIDKLANIGKDFRKIASFLDHKTAADCVEFYYKNHKSESFERTKKKPELRKLENSANTYLVASGKRWAREMNSVSLDLLGEASALAAHEEASLEAAKSMSRRFNGKLRGVSNSIERSSSYNVEDEREAFAADVLAGICGSLSSEAVSSCITSSADPVEACQDLKCQRFSSSSRHPLTPEVTQNIIDEETCSDESCGEMDPVDWTDDEKCLFVQAFKTYGKDFLLISRRVRTKSRDQCKVFFSKARKCLGLETVCPGPVIEQTPVNDDANSSGNYSDDACVIEAGSVVSSDKSGSRMDEDSLVSISDKEREEEMSCKATDLQCDMKLSDHYDIRKLEHRPLDDQKTNDLCHTNFDGEVTVNVVEKPAASQNQDDTVVDVALGAAKEKGIGCDTTIVDSSDSVAEVFGVSGSSASVASMENNVLSRVDENPVELESVSKCVGNQEISSAEMSSKDDVLNQNAVVLPLSSEQGSLGHDESIKAEVNGNLSLEHLSPVETGSSTESDVQPLQVSYLRKCKSSVAQNSVTELNFLPGTIVESEESEDQLPHPFDVNRPRRNGDVKLFGKILGMPSSMCKSRSKVTVKEDNGMLHPSSVSLLDVKESVNHNLNEESIVPKCDGVSHMDIIKNSPMESCGLRNRTSSSLPDSAMILAKYPAFGNLLQPSSRMEQQQEQQQRTLNKKECLLNGASVFSSRETSGRNGVVTELQKSLDNKDPFRLESLQRQELLVDLHQRGYDDGPSKQSDDMGVLKLNVVKVEASDSNGISDPVAVLKSHFANTHAAALSAAVVATATGNGNGKGNVVGEEDSWSM